MTASSIIQDKFKVEEGRCIHCGAESKSEFCCEGCRTIYTAIKESGLERFYDLAGIPLGGANGLEAPAKRKYQEFDASYSVRKLCSQGDGETLIARIPISGIHCAGCIWLLESLPKVDAGITRSRLDFTRGEILVQFDPKAIRLSKIASILNSFGYPPSLKSTGDDGLALNLLLWRLGVSGFAAANTMMLAVSLFQGFFTGITPNVEEYFKWVSFLLTLPAVFYSANPFYQTSFGAMSQGRFHLDQPLTVAFLSAFLLSFINTINGHPYVYYDSVCALIFLLLVGRYTQTRALDKAKRAVKSSWSILPEYATTNGSHVPIEALSEGDVIDVSPGERFPVDGEVIAGESSCDVSVLTGESDLVPIKKGEKVFAGALNITSQLKIRSEKIGTKSRIGRLLVDIDSSDSKYASLGEKASKYFVPTVLLGSAATFVIWIGSGFEVAFNNALSLLIVTCPCALGIAAPAVLGLTIGGAAKKGILIRKASSLEALCDIEHICFDKTGTLTSGEFVLKGYTLFLNHEDKRVGYIKGFLQRLSALSPHHPLSRATRESISKLPFCEHSIAVDECSNDTYIPGKGVRLNHSSLGAVYLGTAEWIVSEIGTSSTIDTSSSSILLAFENTPVLMMNFEDSISDTAKGLVAQIKSLGITPHIISGDSRSAVIRVSDLVGIDPKEAYFRVSPERKIELVKGFLPSVSMVGDGVNDAGALRAATVGIGIKGGVEVTLESASIYLLKGIESFSELLNISKKVKRTVQTTLIVSIFYNLGGAALAALGLMNPLVAAVLMPLSSLTVIGIAISGSK